MEIIYIGNKLARHGISVTNIETLGPQLKSIGYMVRYASDKKNKVLRLMHMVFVILNNRSKAKYVLIDTYSTANLWFAVISAWISLRVKIPYIPILHGGSLPDKIRKGDYKIKFLFKNSMMNITPSDYLKTEMIQAGYPVLHIPNNINLGDYNFELRAVVRPRLLWVRSFHEIYNPKMAIEVVKLLKQKYQDVELCMIGPDKDGTMEEVLDLIRKEKLEKEVTLKGRMNKRDWHVLSCDYDIFINTTNFDNTPVSVIEAMALGLPVVSTNVGGLPFLLTDKNDSFLVNKNDTEGMSSMISKLIDSPELAKQISKNGRKKVENFDWSVVKKQWQDLLIN